MSSHDSDDSQGKQTDSAEFGGLKNRGWVTLRDFAKIADVTYVTVLRWVKLEMINVKQNGGFKRVYQDEIARYLRDGTLPPNPEKLAADKAKRAEYQQNASSSKGVRSS